jgi:hypothetical protein
LLLDGVFDPFGEVHTSVCSRKVIFDIVSAFQIRLVDDLRRAAATAAGTDKIAEVVGRRSAIWR